MLNRRNVYTLVSTLMIFTGIQTLINGFANPDNVWVYTQFITTAQGATALWLLTAALPYSQLFAKTVAGLWAISVTESAVIFPLWYFHIDAAELAHTVHLVSSLLFFVYISVKSYDRIKSDPVQPGYVYQVRAIPNGLQDMLLSVLYLRPFGGTGVIVGDNWYHYRRGRLERDPVSRIPLNKCVILKARKVKPGDVESLNSRIGEKWTWTRNCATRLHPLTVWHRFR